MAVIIASTHLACPRRDGQAELAWVMMIPGVYFYLLVRGQDCTESYRRIWLKFFDGRLDLAQVRCGKILVVIQISIRIKDRIGGFSTVAR